MKLKDEECEIKVKEFGKSIFKAKGKKQKVKKDLKDFFKIKF